MYWWGGVQNDNIPNDSVTTSQKSDNERSYSYIEEESPYLNNRLETGTIVYKNSSISNQKNSVVNVKTGYGGDIDYVVIIKKNNKIVRNSYIRSGDSERFSLPAGSFQIFFYSGKGWDPNKQQANSDIKGGFVSNESFSKDGSVYLDNNELSYELVPQVNGNFQADHSNRKEMFQ